MELEDLKNRLREMLPAARRKAAHLGTMSPLWDDLLDAEALLNGERTVLQGDPEDVAAKLIELLTLPKS